MIPPLQKPPLYASLCALVGLAILLSLGTWQLQRLAWKTGLLAEIDAAYAADAPILTADDLTEDRHLTRAQITGIFHHQKTILLKPRTHNGALGSHVLTALTIDKNRHLLVNRGWIAEGEERYSKPIAPFSISGLLRLPEETNAFTPANKPEAGEWYHADIAAIQAHWNLENIAPVILYAEGPDGILPVGHNARPELSNNHLNYAIFWYLMAVTLAGIFTLRFVVVKKD